MPNTPFNRKRNISGKASEDSMQTHGAGLGQGPVGKKDGYQERRQPQSANRAAQPVNRPRPTIGSASGNMHTSGSGTGSARPQQQRPAGQQSPFAARPQQTQQAQRPQQFQQTQQSAGSSGTRAGGGMGKFIIIALIVLVLGGGGGLSGLFGGGGNDTTNTNNNTSSYTSQSSTQSSGVTDLVGSLLGGGSTGSSGTSSLISGGLSSLLGGYSASSLQDMLGGSWFSGQTGIGSATPASPSTVSTTSGNGGNANYTSVNRSVASGSRAKYTTVKGNGKDTFTIMVYMCGADLESKSAMATRDLQEMLAAQFGSNVRLIVYTGGSKGWRNNMVSSQVNQIWQVKDGGLECLVENAGTAAMTNPATLASFIQYGAKNFKANRYALILWDHGSGSVAGYGYDERNPAAGSMSLAGLNTAFQNGGIQFDFIGFDTCLLASVENALMASNYADYLIASEETEPGIGWYYTNWLTAIGNNTSISTLDIGKQICDDFVTQCASQCRGQQTTLSVTDLAELSNTVPAKLSAFANGITTLVTNQDYKSVSNARNGSREFATSARIDQVDLTDLCNNLNTAESNALAKALRAAVKYNRTSIADAYGLSVYFPYQKMSNVDKAVSTYAAIGMDDSYSKAIRAFASVEASGQAVTGGVTSAIPSLFGLSGGSGASSSSSGDMISSLLSSFLGGGMGDMSSLMGDFLGGRTMTEEQLGTYLSANILDSNNLVFRQDGDRWVIDMTPDQWALVHGVDQNLFYDNGAGYVDMGLDNLFEFDESGRLVADTSGAWVAINGQPVPYYHETSQQTSDTEWRITGYVPCLLNGDRAELLLTFDQDGSTVAGARPVYVNGETETIAKAIDEIKTGDTIAFLADLYDYDQNYIDSYVFGRQLTVDESGLTVSDVYLPDPSKAMITYRFTDIYNQAYWTPVIGK
ncbi:MAG: peptidase C11 [Clostridia bacterium]|nr:peptidase C11 [Clostridia bacterium]